MKVFMNVSQLKFAKRYEGAGSGLGSSAGDAAENAEDEASILSDQDQSGPNNDLQASNMDGVGRVGHSLEEEPGDFMRGEIDSKEQMDRTQHEMDLVLHGDQGHAGSKDPSNEIEASFEATPGGLDEITARERGLNESFSLDPWEDIDDDEINMFDANPATAPDPDETATASGSFGDLDDYFEDTDRDQPYYLDSEKEQASERASQSGRPGHATGSFTDIGAGRSGVTRQPQAGKTPSDDHRPSH